MIVIKLLIIAILAWMMISAATLIRDSYQGFCEPEEKYDPSWMDHKQFTK